MIKVIHVITDTNIGGAGTVLLTVLRNIDRSRFDVRVILPYGSALIPRVDSLGFEHICVKCSTDSAIHIGSINEYSKIFKDEKPDIVHTHSTMSARIAAFLCGVRVRIHTRHSVGILLPLLTKFPFRNIYGFVCNTLSTRILSVSESARDNLVAMGINQKKIQIVTNGAEPLRNVTAEETAGLKRTLGINDGDFVAGMSTRLEERRGHLYLIEAARILHERGLKNFKVLIIGNGPAEDSLKAKAQEYGLTDSIIFTGFVTDVAPYVKIMDVIVNCSFGTDAVGMTLVEAMSLAKPAIATDCGDNTLTVENGKNGYIIPQKSASNLAEAIQKLMSNPDKHLEMAKFAYSKYICRLTGKIMTGKLEKIYEDGYNQRCKK